MIDNMWIFNINIIYRKGINTGVIGATQDGTRWESVRKDKYENWGSFGSTW